MRGFVEIALYDAHQSELKRIKAPIMWEAVNNTIVTAGRSWVLRQIISSDIVTSQSIGFMAVGTGTNAPATSDSALQSETTRLAIGTFTTSNLTSNPPSWMAQMSLATNQGNTTLGEVGLFNSSSGGTLLGRATFSTLNKTTSNTLGLSYTVSN
jgi:hypothetical protein